MLREEVIQLTEVSTERNKKKPRMFLLFLENSLQSISLYYYGNKHTRTQQIVFH